MTPSIDSRDLVLMRALEAHGGVTHAARALSLTQSAVSHHLARLEDKLGVSLFTRAGRGLRITAEGRRLVQGGNPLLDQLLALERSLAPAPDARIRVTTQCHTAYDWLASVLGRFGRLHPNTRIVVKVDCTRTPLAALRDGKVDLAICHEAAGRDLAAHVLGEDPFVVVLSADHPLARGDVVRPAQLTEENLIVHDLPAPELASLGRAWFGPHAPTRVTRMPLTEAMVELCAAGHGVAMMPGWAARQALRRDDVVVRPFSKKSARRVWRAVTPTALRGRADVKDLIAELKAWFAMRGTASV